MMKFFRPDIAEESGSSWKNMFWLAVFLVIVGSFIWQMSLGLCPVP
jgi:hypothetical protein